MNIEGLILKKCGGDKKDLKTKHLCGFILNDLNYWVLKNKLCN
jgi:hypothetical protein